MTGQGHGKVQFVSTDQERMETGRRLKAARVLGGFDNLQQLASAIGERGLGLGVLKRVEAGSRELQPSEASVIARACGLDHSFFYAPRGSLGIGAVQPGEIDAPDDHDVMLAVQGQLDDLTNRLADLRDDLVRSEVIMPRTVTPAERAAVRKLGAAGARSAATGQRSPRQGRGGAPR
jgi:hypothetical protein